jgi:hypothetical protein
MNTTTTASTGACSTGRMTMRSIATPRTKPKSTVMRNAGQYGTPAVRSVQAM